MSIITTTPVENPGAVRAVAALSYAAGSYLFFFATFVAFAAFVGGLFPPPFATEVPSWIAVAVDAGLILGFGLQHSIMARPGFKRAWTRIVPETIERSTYVLVAGIVTLVMLWQWRSIPIVVWNVETPAGRVALWRLFAAGCVLVPPVSFMLS